ncbi:MAG: hypothetical protein LBV09_02965 [Deferribacteraceae bacterium]|jgi:hypothetical protein|nr:hypothetical protein [Deferribacteraceae bacterium]
MSKQSLQSSWSPSLIEYLEAKPAHPRTVHLITLTNHKYVSSFVEQTRPSVQSFKLFMERLRDFSDLIEGDTYDKEMFDAITDRRSPIHKEVDDIMTVLRRKVDVKNNDNFESSRLHWSFTTDSVEDLDNTIKKLESLREVAKSLYGKLDDPR